MLPYGIPYVSYFHLLFASIKVAFQKGKFFARNADYSRFVINLLRDIVSKILKRSYIFYFYRGF